MNPKTILCMLFALLAMTGQAKEKTIVWNQPATAENQWIGEFGKSLLEITRVEFDQEETRVMMRVRCLPNRWIKFVSETYLKTGEKRYALKGCDGLELDKEVFLTDHGRVDVVFHFEPLPTTTECFDFIEGDIEGAFKLLGVEDVATRAQRLFPSSWRNEQTGDWEIGFYDDFAIYDCRFWGYKTKQQKGGKYIFVLESDGQEMTVIVGKSKAGKRTITIDGKKSECEFLSSISLPDYPAKDTCTTFRDTHYETDTVTLVGWLKDIPEGFPGCEVLYHDLFTTEGISSYIKTDPQGRFEMKIPLVNTSEVYIDALGFIVLEPGETYFLFYDFKEGHKFFMGENSRLQNETLSLPIWLSTHLQGYPEEMDEAEAMQFLEREKGRTEDLLAELEKTLHEHPTVSDRYIIYKTSNIKANEAERLMQGRIYTKQWRLPDAYLEYVGREHWQGRIRPYTLLSISRFFWFDYIDQLVNSRNFIKIGKYTIIIDDDMVPTTLQRYRDAGKLTISDEELAILRRMAEERRKVYTEGQTKEAIEKASEAYRQQDYVKQGIAIKEREDVRQIIEAESPLFWLYRIRSVLDSIGCDRDLHDIIITYFMYKRLDGTRQSLQDTVMQYFDENVSMPAAKAFLWRMQEKYLALRRRDISKNPSLKSNESLAETTEGEELLRQLIEPYRGRFVLIDVWGTWCGPCKEALAESKEEYERLKDYDMVYLYLANHSDDTSWKNVIKEYDLVGEDIVHYNLPDDQQSAIERYLKVNSFPSYRLVDRDGTVLDVNADPRYDIDGLARLLDQIK